MTRTIPPSPRRRLPRLRPGHGVTLLLLTVGIGATATARAQPRTDAVEHLRQILRTPATPAEYDAGVKACLGNLRGLSELRRALVLSEWRLTGATGAEGQMDTLNRTLVLDRFLHEVRANLQRDDAVTASVIVGMVGETAEELRKQDDGAGFMRSLGPDLAAVTRRGDVRLRAEAARVIGQIQAEATVAAPALADLLQAQEPALRRAAVDGLTVLLDAVGAELHHAGGPKFGSADRGELLRTATVFLTAVGRALADPSAENRRAAAFAVGKAAAFTAQLIPDPPSADQFLTTEARLSWWQATQVERAAIRPLLSAVREQGVLLVRALGRGDAEERLAMQVALEEITNVRARWLRQAAGMGPADDLLLDVFQAALPALAEATADRDTRVRRSAIEVLEGLGTAATPAAPALAAALDDTDRFVRWSAVRALRNIGPVAARCATPGLARLLEDPDVDVRLAAAGALEQFAPPRGNLSEVRPVTHTPARLSPFARTALPPLLRSLRSDDTAVRSAAMRTLRGLGSEARVAVPALREALADSNSYIREAAAETLGAVGPEARAAVEDLRKATQDSNAEVRRAAGEALLIILRGPEG